MTDTDATATPTTLIQRLNSSWRVTPPAPASPSLGHRLAYRVRLLVARVLRPQETFNSEVVRYLNATHTAAEEYALATDEARRYSEALAAHERRLDAAMQTLRRDHDQLATAVGVLQQATQSLARSRAPSPESRTANPEFRIPSPESRIPGPDTSHALSHRYVGFEDQFRGSPDAIRARLADYVTLFAGAADVLDVGCGRGEFLGLLREHGISGRGIDLNDSMVEVSRAAGFDATHADALGYLQSLPDGSLGGLFAAQVVEHLEPAYLTHLLDAAFAKLRPGSPIVLETINPACWFAFFESYIRDITHVRPLHPDTLQFLLIAAGFQRIEIRYRVPYPEHDKLQPVGPALGDAAETINANVDKINRLLFTHLDYAAVGRRP